MISRPGYTYLYSQSELKCSGPIVERYHTSCPNSLSLVENRRIVDKSLFAFTRKLGWEMPIIGIPEYKLSIVALLGWTNELNLGHNTFRYKQLTQIPNYRIQVGEFTIYTTCRSSG